MNNQNFYFPEPHNTNFLYSNQCYPPQRGNLALDIFNRGDVSFCEDFKVIRDRDRHFIDDFVNKTKNKVTDVACQMGVNLHEAKLKIESFMNLKEDMLNLRQELCETSDLHVKNKIWDEVLVKKEKVEKILETFDDETIRNIKSKLEKRRKKRGREKLKRIQAKERRRLEQEQAERRRKKIDDWFNKKQNEMEKIRIEESLKRQADVVLKEVNHKKFEAKKVMNLVKSLKKLREIREKNGNYCSVGQTDIFNTVVDRVNEMWVKQLKIYETEELGLKVMLEESASERVDLQHTKLINILHDWESTLFGRNVSVIMESEMLTKADYDINTFINVRHSWDKYLASSSSVMSSTIPSGWVIPVAASSDTWSKYLT